MAGLALGSEHTTLTSASAQPAQQREPPLPLTYLSGVDDFQCCTLHIFTSI